MESQTQPSVYPQAHNRERNHSDQTSHTAAEALLMEGAGSWGVSQELMTTFGSIAAQWDHRVTRLLISPQNTPAFAWWINKHTELSFPFKFSVFHIASELVMTASGTLCQPYANYRSATSPDASSNHKMIKLDRYSHHPLCRQLSEGCNSISPFRFLRSDFKTQRMR